MAEIKENADEALFDTKLLGELPEKPIENFILSIEKLLDISAVQLVESEKVRLLYSTVSQLLKISIVYNDGSFSHAEINELIHEMAAFEQAALALHADSEVLVEATEKLKTTASKLIGKFLITNPKPLNGADEDEQEEWDDISLGAGVGALARQAGVIIEAAKAAADSIFPIKRGPKKDK